MRKTSYYIVLSFLLLMAGTLLAEVTLEYFKAQSKYDNITLEWKSSSESGISYYTIQRKTMNSEFTEIDRVPARGSNQVYTYVDSKAYKTSDVLYTYRLGYNNSMSYSQELKVSHNVSIGKRTWGSIKDMFR